MAVIAVVLISVAFYDRFIQRENQLLINFPLVGRLRYFFYMMRNPMRQYFGDETFYDSFEKLLWINKVVKKEDPSLSFSPAKPYANQHTLFRHANIVNELNEVDTDFSVTFGSNCRYPFVTRSIIGRSAMSDGAISPEGTRAFARGAAMAHFPINTGEGGLTSNFLTTLHCRFCNKEYLEFKKGTLFAKSIYHILRSLTNAEIAQRIYRKMVVRQKDRGTFIFDDEQLLYFRINWESDLEHFPIEVPKGLPDIVFQIGSGLYGVQDADGSFDAVRYQKVIRFCRMTEVKLAQGAKQTGGKLLANKVNDDIAYYRGVQAHRDLISPNRFPYAETEAELFDFIEELQQLSGKPVGFKIVLSDREGFEVYAKELKKRKDAGRGLPEFITIDGGDGGSATAPLEMMSRIGLPVREALLIANEVLSEYGLRDEIRLIAAEKVLTADDVVELLCYGADFINIARGFMISAGCIRARQCSGAGGRNCPVGLATMNEAKRSKFLVLEKSRHIANYHDALVQGIRSLLAVMGKRSVQQLSMKDLEVSRV
ncbi:FMN-binding glutamate synthase family protein [Sulfurovum indicum]|uniref:FMN-binding glutamate synthase family protein n=2 Tax=Sulfurovaceae TaxID=2771472 RepID=A0A7M1S6D5_9BACT|nr:FMN-binding glutamate synthase family protein [Sulfurovum indicum]